MRRETGAGRSGCSTGPCLHGAGAEPFATLVVVLPVLLYKRERRGSHFPHPFDHRANVTMSKIFQATGIKGPQLKDLRFKITALNGEFLTVSSDRCNKTAAI